MKNTVLFLLVVAALSGLASAVDGVTLINQATVNAAGGFPYKITSSGSYKLSGNVSVPFGVNGFLINADNVTFDLNGFTISGTAQGYASAFYGTGRQHIRISNGIVTGIGAVYLDGNSRTITVENLIIDSTVYTAESTLQGNDVVITGNLYSAGSIIRNVIGQGYLTINCPALIVESHFAIFNPVLQFSPCKFVNQAF